MSKVARHPRHPDVVNMSLDEIAQRYTVRFADIKPDWNVFDDAKIAGYRRAQYRYIGQTLGKPEIKYIPAGERGCSSCMCRPVKAMRLTRIRWRKFSSFCKEI